MPVQHTQSAADKEALEDKKLKQKCLEFESILFYEMLKTMRRTVPKSGFIDGGNAEEIYTSLLDLEYAKSISRETNSSLAEALYEQLKPPVHSSHEANK